MRSKIIIEMSAMPLKIFLRKIPSILRRKELFFVFIVVFILVIYGLVKLENMVGKQILSQMMISQHNSSTHEEHRQVK